MQVQFDKEAVLAGHFLLQHLSRDELRHLAQAATLSNYRSGATIFQRGDPGDSMMAVIRGRIKICVHSIAGKEMILNFIDRGGIFGEIAVIDGEPRTADAVAIGETDLLVLRRERLAPFLTGHADTTLRLMQVLCKRLRRTNDHLADVLFYGASSRLARWILRLAESFGKPTPAGTRIDLKMSQQQLGNLVGISRESTNKALSEWVKDEVIAIDAGFITILDKEALTDISEIIVEG
jgi:CRP/FNR family transcriptional regulator, cyclic AMP receptor protein